MHPASPRTLFSPIFSLAREKIVHGMAIKTVIRNLLSKYGYLSIEMQQAFENDVEGAEEHTDAMPTMGTQRFDVSDVSFEEVSNTSANTATASNENKPGF